jgi:UDP-N-acetyl-2-amino-2-deoxyglucuronate dehydrogenase
MGNKRLKLGFIGCGRISQKHFDALKQLNKQIEVVAVCDIDEEKLAKVGEMTTARQYLDVNTMLSSENLEIVTVATPNGLHYEHAMKVLKSGRHVIIEKPMTLNIRDADALINEAKTRNLKIFVIYQNRFNDPVQYLMRAISENRFGKIYMITSNVFWQRPQDYYDKEGSWHGTKALDGGALMTQASHYVDLIQWIAGANPKQVYSTLRTLARNIETEDTGSVILEFENDIVANINVTVLTYPKNLEGSVIIIGEKGTVKLGGVALNEVLHWDFSDQKDYDEQIKLARYETGSVYGFGHLRNYENIVQSLLNNEKALINGEEGRKSLRILSGIYESNYKNMPINFYE